MPISSFVENDLFVIRITKYHANNPDRKWANSYEFQAVDTGGEGALLMLANKLVLFEVAIHLGVVVFDRALISTWEADSKPYNPAVFVTSTLTATGAFGAVTEPVGLTTAYAVTRACGTGRVGHLFYRGCLTEDLVTAPAGKSILTDRPGMQDGIDDALSSSGFGNYIGVGEETPLKLVMINRAGDNVRPVIALRAQGITNLPVDHAWFNRTTPV